MQDACVCLSVCLCVAICQKLKLNKRIRTFKFAHVLKLVDGHAGSLTISNSTPMDLLNMTADHDRQGQAAHRRYCQIT